MGQYFEGCHGPDVSAGPPSRSRDSGLNYYVDNEEADHMLSESLFGVLRVVSATKQTVHGMQVAQQITPDAAHRLLRELDYIGDQVFDIVNEADYIYVIGGGPDAGALSD